MSVNSKKDKTLIFLVSLGLFFTLIIIVLSVLNSSNKNNKQTPLLVDNNIISSTDKDYSYMNSNSNFSTYFPDELIDIDDNIKFEKNGSSVSFSLLSSDIKKTIGKSENNQIFYPKIFQNGDQYIDLRYTVYTDKLSEELILNKKQELPKFRQKLKLFNAYATQNSNQINFYNPATNQLLWFIPAPIMYEQNNPEIQNSEIVYHLECEDIKTPLSNCRSLIFTKEITPEGQKWLNDSNRNYPVVIDPNIQLNNADVYTQWLSSNTAVLVVSQENTIKMEGSGSIKLSGVAVAGSCWGISGSCDANCKNTGIGSSLTVYTDCNTGGTVCPGTTGWGIGGVIDSGCNKSSYTSGSYFTTCSSAACPNTNCWTINSACDTGCVYSNLNSTFHYSTCTKGASCGAPPLAAYTRGGGTSKYCPTGACVAGSGNCYKVPALYSYYNYSSTSCGSGCGHTTISGCIVQSTTYYTQCTWVSAKTGYTASSSVTRYSGSGTCASTNTGNCYKLTGSDDVWTGNNSCPAGGSDCSGKQTLNTGVSACAWSDGLYPKTVSSPVTRYTGNNIACNSGGTGSCYKMVADSTDTFTGDSACGSGATNCANPSIRYTYTPCSFYTAGFQNAGTQITQADLSSASNITFWVRSNTTGSFLNFNIGENGYEEQIYNININSANTWEQKTWDLSGINDSSLDAIKFMSFKITDVSKTFTFYFDDIRTNIDFPQSKTPTNCNINQGANNSSFELHWQDNAITENGYHIYKDIDGGGFTFLDTVSANISTYNDNSISSGHTYSYRVFAYNSILGYQVTSVPCDFPSLRLGEGNEQMEGIKMEGININ